MKMRKSKSRSQMPPSQSPHSRKRTRCKDRSTLTWAASSRDFWFLRKSIWLSLIAAIQSLNPWSTQASHLAVLEKRELSESWSVGTSTLARQPADSGSHQTTSQSGTLTRYHHREGLRGEEAECSIQIVWKPWDSTLACSKKHPQLLTWFLRKSSSKTLWTSQSPAASWLWSLS